MSPNADAIRLAQRVDNILDKYSLHATWAGRECHLLCNVAPKHHYVWHMGQQARYLNPRKSNTMLDETFMGVIKDVARSCSRVNAVEKYMMGIAVVFQTWR